MVVIFSNYNKCFLVEGQPYEFGIFEQFVFPQRRLG